MELQGKTALITGGGHRVGRVITLELASAGANVVVNYNSSAEAARATAAEAEARGVDAIAVQANVGNAEQVTEMAAAAAERFGAVDVLVNNASTFIKDPFPTDDLTVWRRSIDTLVHGPFYCSNALAPQMLASGQGAIINIGDLSAFEPWPGFTGHGVGKSALLALTRQLALELSPAITVNAVVPGPTLRPHDYDDDKYARTAAKTLLGRWGTPEDMAKAARFLIESDYITGETITVDGGQRYGHRKNEEG
ncbi:MAG: SDR family oxidoreductase [Actinomycetota bacterium]|jgi:NAD(P)-dependent dehydrogenase (short-subunit alcohol dehydrogenase family)|nr:SDR family oxidoreductase [Actinomycetota bacterium]